MSKEKITRTRPKVQTRMITFRASEEELATFQEGFERYLKLHPEGVRTFTDWAKAALTKQIQKQEAEASKLPAKPIKRR